MQKRQETWVWSLGWENPLEEGMAAHSSILAWEIPWTEEPGGLESVGLQRVGHGWEAKHTCVINFQLLLEQISTNLVAENSTSLLSYSSGGQSPKQASVS